MWVRNQLFNTLLRTKCSIGLKAPKVQSCIGGGPKSQRSEPCERSEACSDRSDEARDCEL